MDMTNELASCMCSCTLWQRPTQDTLCGDIHGQDIAIRVKLHAINTDHAMVQRGVIRIPTMIDDIVILTIRREDTVMPGTRADIIISSQDPGRRTRERASRRRPSDIADAVGVISPPMLVSLARPRRVE